MGMCSYYIQMTRRYGQALLVESFLKRMLPMIIHGRNLAPQGYLKEKRLLCSQLIITYIYRVAMPTKLTSIIKTLMMAHLIGNYLAVLIALLTTWAHLTNPYMFQCIQIFVKSK